MMFRLVLEELTRKFHALDESQKDMVFVQVSKNAEYYNKMIPNVPLFLYILEGDSAVPEYAKSSEVIRQYKAWYLNPNNRAKLRS
jgi:hypothetical protein